MSLLVKLLGLVFCLSILFVWSRRRFFKLMFQVPGPKGLPFIGILHKVRSLEGLYLFGEECVKNYTYPIFCWVGPIPVFVIADPQTAQDILTSPNCVNRACIYDSIIDVFGNGLLTKDNPEWSAHRKLLNPSFSHENLRSFVPIFNEKTKASLKDFEASYGGESIDILPVMQRLSMNIALQTTMGLKTVNEINSYNDKTEEKLFQYYHYLAEKAMIIIIMPWLRLRFIQNLLSSFRKFVTSKTELSNFFKNLIGTKLEQLSNTDSKAIELSKNTETEDYDLQKTQKNIFIDIAIDLLKNGKFTAKEVEEHSNNIVAGAFETTATTITHVFIMLAMNPQHQEITFQELFSLYPERDNITVTDEDLQRLVYMEMVINETMRLIPTIPLVGRSTTCDVQLSSGITLPAGIQILIDMFHLHVNKDIWGPNAFVFNPENFLPENMMDKHPYTFIPFSKGIRTCIGSRYGMNATKVMLAIMLRKYKLTTTSKFEELRYEPTITTRIINAPLLKFHLREI